MTASLLILVYGRAKGLVLEGAILHGGGNDIKLTVAGREGRPNRVVECSCFHISKFTQKEPSHACAYMAVLTVL